jgi:pimeloyl-ACP methyl ester carboxylesterase
MRRLRKVLRRGLVIVLIWIGICAGIGIMAAEMALHPGRRALGTHAKENASDVAARNGAELTEVAVTAVDGVTLRAWSIRHFHGNGDAVILLHGHTDNRAGMLGNADLLLRHGFAVLLPDARAHGISGGDISTCGVMESGDIRRWFDSVQKAEAPRCVDGLGESMGAAQLLESLRTTPGFCAVVAECPFASFREASYDRLAERLDAGAWLGRTLLRPAVDTGFLYTRWKYGVD